MTSEGCRLDVAALAVRTIRLGPDAKQPSGTALVFARVMTADEVKEAWASHGFVEVPWKNKLAGPGVQVSVPGQ